MGNSSSKKNANKQIVSLQMRHFNIETLPIKPDEWSDRIPFQVWNELEQICRDAIPKDGAVRQAEYKKYKCYFWLGMLALLVGIGAANGMGIPGGIAGVFHNMCIYIYRQLPTSSHKCIQYMVISLQEILHYG